MQQRNHTETQPGKCNKALFQSEPGRYIEFFFWASWQFLLLAVPRNQLETSVSVVATSTHKHTTHSGCTSLRCKAICKSATQFDFCRSSRTVYASFRSPSPFQTAVSKPVSRYLAFTYLPTPPCRLSARLFSSS